MKYQAEDIANYYSLGSRQLYMSNGWINKFKKGNNTVYITLTSESRHVDSGTAVDRKNDQLLQKTKEYDPYDICNSDKTGLFLNLQPGKSHTFCGGPCHDGTKSKQQVTLFHACSADGSRKLPPLVIGR
jgi:hypothetical protein